MNTHSPPSPDRPLDADIEALLDLAIDPALDAAAQARIKSKLLRRIAQQTTDNHLTLKAAQGQWQPFGRGLQIKVLNAASDGILSYLVRMGAGSNLPAHRHPVDEECVVLEGEVRLGSLRIAAGGFHLGRKDVLHDDLHSDEGALIFLRGAAPELAQVI